LGVIWYDSCIRISFILHFSLKTHAPVIPHVNAQMYSSGAMGSFASNVSYFREPLMGGSMMSTSSTCTYICPMPSTNLSCGNCYNSIGYGNLMSYPDIGLGQQGPAEIPKTPTTSTCNFFCGGVGTYYRIMGGFSGNIPQGGGMQGITWGQSAGGVYIPDVYIPFGWNSQNINPFSVAELLPTSGFCGIFKPKAPPMQSMVNIGIPGILRTYAETGSPPNTMRGIMGFCSYYGSGGGYTSSLGVMSNSAASPGY